VQIEILHVVKANLRCGPVPVVGYSIVDGIADGPKFGVGVVTFSI